MRWREELFGFHSFEPEHNTLRRRLPFSAVELASVNANVFHSDGGMGTSPI